MRLFLAGGIRADNFQCDRIDNADRTIKLSADIQQAVLGAEHWEGGPHAFTEINVTDYFPGSEVNHHHVLTIHPRVTNAEVPVDRHRGRPPVRGVRSFVPADA